jgi:hypothetical protein
VRTSIIKAEAEKPLTKSRQSNFLQLNYLSMNSNNLINAWKNADANATTETPVAGVSVNLHAMEQISGGANSAGYVCSLSGECVSSGKNCWDAAADFIKDLF